MERIKYFVYSSLVERKARKKTIGTRFLKMWETGIKDGGKCTSRLINLSLKELVPKRNVLSLKHAANISHDIWFNDCVSYFILGLVLRNEKEAFPPIPSCHCFPEKTQPSLRKNEWESVFSRYLLYNFTRENKRKWMKIEEGRGERRDKRGKQEWWKS